jgi:malonyl CoA-acyl carrier protein transacylase
VNDYQKDEHGDIFSFLARARSMWAWAAISTTNSRGARGLRRGRRGARLRAVELIFEGPEETLKLTEHTQPAILTVSTAAARVLAEALGWALRPALAAGHSLGEYSAHVAAGTLSFADAVRAVRLRGRYMQQAVPAGEGAMAAILGLEPGLIQVICEQVEDQLTPLPKTPEAWGSMPGWRWFRRRI